MPASKLSLVVNLSMIADDDALFTSVAKYLISHIASMMIPALSLVTISSILLFLKSLIIFLNYF